MHWGEPDCRRPQPGCKPAGACRASAACLASAGPVEVPGVGGDAPATALLASDDRGACPAQLYRLPVRAGAGDVPFADNQGKAVARYDRADPDSQRKPQAHQPDQGLRDPCVHPPGSCAQGRSTAPASYWASAASRSPPLTARDTSSTASAGRLATGGPIGSGTIEALFVFWRLPLSRARRSRRCARVAADSGWNLAVPGENTGGQRQGLPASCRYSAVVSAAGGTPTCSCSRSASSW
jgi:hypothetical protein